MAFKDNPTCPMTYPAAAVDCGRHTPTPAASDRHGPRQPLTDPYGVAHLCTVMNLHDPDVDRLCEDAALEITRLRERVPAPRWGK